jgi:hypothetical protein
MNISEMFSMIAILIFVSFWVVGCASTSGNTQQIDRSDWEWVPSVWVQDNPFTGDKYIHCFYDQGTDYYLCPPGTK